MFTLNIQFWGLCLFVPDPAEAGTIEMVHVLMPAAGVPGGMQGMPPHLARVYADAGYLSLGTSVLGNLVELDDLDGKHLWFGGGSAPDLSFPAQLANLRDTTDQPLDSSLFGPDPGEKLTARVGLGSGAYVPIQNPICWRFPPSTPRRPLVSTAVWTIPDLPDAELRLDLLDLGTGGTSRTITLFPVNNEITISIYHTEAALLPGGSGAPPIQPGQSAPHFPAYYMLYGLMSGPAPVAEPCSDSDIHGHDYGAIPYTCMGPAQSTIG